MNMTLSEIAQAMGTCCDVHDETEFLQVCIDSRSVQPGDLFVCIVGQKLDGHQFVSQAVAAGATAVVASTPLDTSVPVLMVRDTTLALGQLARAWRERTRATVIGVTGSAGKTTIKEMLAQVLAGAGRTSKNFRNLNNQIGLPLSVLDMAVDDAYWVLELGISHVGDMDKLGHILAPDAVVITNVGACHLEGLGSLDGVASEKCVLLQHLRAHGLACINADYPLLMAESARYRVRRTFYSGTGGAAPYSCLGQTVHGETVRFELRMPSGLRSFEVSTSVHVPENMAAAVALCVELGVSPEVIEQGLLRYMPVPQRFVRSQIGAWTFIDDTYNANPVSMASSIQEAERIAAERPLVLVLGDMLELGPQSRDAHRELGQLIANTACTHCFFCGQHAEDVRSGLHGFLGAFYSVRSAEEVARALADLRSEEGVMLFKGSRGCKMEHYYTFLERNWL